MLIWRIWKNHGKTSIWGHLNRESPIAGWFVMDNPTKMDDEQGYPHVRKPPSPRSLMFLFFSCSRTTGPRRLSISCAGLCQRLAFHHVGPRFPTPGGFPVVGWSLIWWEVSQVLAYKHFPLKFGGVFHAGVEVPWLMSHSSNRPKLGQGIFQVNYVLVCSCMLLCYESFRWMERKFSRWMPWNGASGSQRVSRLVERRKLCDLLRESHDQSILLVVPHSQLSWLWLGWQRFMVTQGGSYNGVTPIADLGVSGLETPI